MKNNRDRVLIILAVLVVIIAGVIVVGLKSMNKGDKAEETTKVSVASTQHSIADGKSEDGKLEVYETSASSSEDQKFIDNGSPGESNIKETTAASNNEPTNSTESSQPEDGTNALKGGSEYNFPYEPSNVYGDNNKSAITNTNPRFIFGDYISKDIKVDSQFVKVYLSIDSNLYGESADNQLNEYNKTHKAKYTVECNPGWENAMLRIGIQYPHELDDPNKKIEPIINIGGGSGYNGVNYQGNSYSIPVSVIYDSVDENGRTGYIIAKIPKEMKEFYLRFGDDTVWSFKVKR